MAKYSVGLPQTGVRSLSPEEMEELRRLAKPMKRVAIACWILLPFVMFVWLAAVASLPGDEVSPLHIAGMLLGLTALGLAAAFAKERGRRSKMLRKDLKLGTVMVFEGVPIVEPGSRVQARLIELSQDVHRFDFESVHVVEVLQHSNRIYRFDGQFVKEWVAPEVIEIGTPDEAGTQYPRMIEQVELGMRTGIRRRALSQSERTELNRLWRRTILSAVMLGAVTLFLIFAGAQYRDPARTPPAPFSLLFIGIVTLDILFTTVLPSLVRCRRDAVNGIVLVFDIPEPEPMHAPEPAFGRRINVEALPISRRIWTVDGRAAEWRRRVARVSER